MVDVSKVVTVSDVSLYQQGDVLQVRIHGQQAWWLTKKQFEDFVQAAQLLIEREAKVEE